MKTTTRKLLDSVQALTVLSDTEIPAVLAMNISIVLKDIQNVLSAFRDTHNKLLTKYGDPIPDQPGSYKIKDMDKYNEELKAMEEREVTLDIEPFSVTMLGTANVKPKVLLTLDWLIVR